MNVGTRRGLGRFRLFAWLVALALGSAGAPGACTSVRDDRFVLLRRGPARAPGAPTPLGYPAAGDAGAARVQRLMSDEFTGELLRTYAMARRLAGVTAPRGSVRWARAEAPAYLVLGVSDLDDRQRPYRDRVIGTGGWAESIAADVPLVWIDEELAHLELGEVLASTRGREDTAVIDQDAVALDQIVRGLGTAILSLVPRVRAPAGGDAAPDLLTEGYVRFLEVVDAEWRTTGSVAGAAGDARARLRRAGWFADVRGNQGVERLTAAALVRDPIVIATVLYRLSASAAGHRLAPDETYRALVPEFPPAGFSPGQLLGAFRNFQAKLLVAWTRAGQAGRPPGDLIDLVEAYADAYPAERAEVTRIFLVTTYGLTARPGGVYPRQPPQQVASKLAALTADVLFGRVGMRDGARNPGN
jgi:hypothetical protein